MVVLKTIGLGVLFSILFFVLWGLIAYLRGGMVVEHSHATGLSAIKAGTIYNPYFWLPILVAFGAAFWLAKKS